MNFGAFLLRRLIGVIGVLIGVSLITFGVSHVVPADPAVAALGDHATDAQIAQFRAEYGLDRSVPDQYVIYVQDLLRGDFGTSIRTRRPVSQDLLQFFPATLELAFAALLVALLIGIPTGILSALYRNRLPDNVARVFALIGGSLPIFWLGLLLIELLYNDLGWLPAGGRLDDFLQPPTRITGLFVVDSLLAGNMVTLQDSMWHLILPAFVLGYFSTAVITRMMRSSMLEVLHQDYMRTARAKGLREGVVIVRHGFRNAFIPTLTIIGITFGSLLAGAVLTETVFTWPGLGLYATASAISLDFPAVMGVTLLAAVVYLLANFVVDMMYTWFDPRIKNG